MSVGCKTIPPRVLKTQFLRPCSRAAMRLARQENWSDSPPSYLLTPDPMRKTAGHQQRRPDSGSAPDGGLVRRRRRVLPAPRLAANVGRVIRREGAGNE